MNSAVLPTPLGQALWLNIDTKEQVARGHTQLQLRCASSTQGIGLFAQGLTIVGVKVDGEDVDYTQLVVEQQNDTPELPQGAAQLADYSFYEYQRLVQKEAEPDLIVHLPDRSDDTAQADVTQPEMESEDATMQAHVELAVTVAFEIHQPKCGLRFHGAYAYTDNQLRRSRAWFPCVDEPLSACPYELHFTVAAKHMAISCGTLTKQSWSDGGDTRTFHYKLDIPAPPQDISLAVGPFVAMQATLPPKPIQVKPGDSVTSAAASAAAAAAGPAAGAPGQGPPSTPLLTPPYSSLRTPRTPAVLDAFSKGDSIITHFAPADLRSAADHTMKTLGLAFNMFETYLGCRFPYKALQTVVLPEGIARQSFQSAAGLQILGGELLVTERTVEQGIESRLAVAYAVAQQWFGVLMRPRTPADAWLVEGLAGYLHDLFLRRFLGKNELRYRRYKQRQAIYAADDGQAPPLYSKASPALLWGSMYGTEHLDPSGLRKWKATAVMWLLSQKVSEDIFRKQLERLVGAVANHLQQGGNIAFGPGAAPGIDSEHDPRLLSSKEFFRELGKGSGARKELSALSLRWINLRGLPLVTAAFTYHKKRNAIEVAVRQQGSQAARKSTEVAAEQAAKDGAAVGLLKLMLKEHDHDNIQMVQLAAKPLLLQEIKVNTKPGARRAKKAGKKKKDEEHEDLDDEEQTQHDHEVEDAAAADRPPIQWVQMDPQHETLASLCLLQPDWMWANQLDQSKDTAAQSAAVAGLAALQPCTYTVVAALEHCLQDELVYPRIRCEAAMALAATASQETEYAGYQALLKLFRSRFHNSSTSQLLSQSGQSLAGCNVGEYLVNQALPLALASVRDEKGHSMLEAAEMLVDMLHHTDNRGSFYNDDSMLAAALEALGRLRLPDSKSLKPIVEQLDRFLARGRVLPSYHGIVAQAGLRAFVELALTMRANSGFKTKFKSAFVSKVAGICSEHSQEQWHPELRRTAYDCLVRMAAALSGLDAAISLCLDVVAHESAPLVRLGVMEDIQPIVLEAVSHSSQTPLSDPLHPPANPQQNPLDPPTMAIATVEAQQPAPSPPFDSSTAQVSQEVLIRIHDLFNQQHDVKLRHLAFMLLSRLGSLPPTLYRPAEEPETAGPQEPTTSMQTHNIVPAAVGPAKSGGWQGVPSGALPSAEPSMQDLEEVTGKEAPRTDAPSKQSHPWPELPHLQHTSQTAAQGQPQQQMPALGIPAPQPAVPSRKRPKSASPAPLSLQESGAVVGPAPVTAEELEAIMKGGSQQPKQRRKKQKTDPSAPDSGRTLSPAPRFTPEPDAVAVEGMHQQQQQQQHGVADAHAPGAGQFAVPLSQGPGPAQTSTAAALQPHANPTVQQQQQQQQPFTFHAGQGIEQQPQSSLQQSKPPAQAAAGAVPVEQQQAQPADSTAGGSVLSGSAYGTEEERLERKRQRQLEKQRIKDTETLEEKAARRQAKRDKKARKSTRADTFSMADSAGNRTVDMSDITS